MREMSVTLYSNKTSVNEMHINGKPVDRWRSLQSSNLQLIGRYYGSLDPITSRILMLRLFKDSYLHMKRYCDKCQYEFGSIGVCVE